LNRTINRITVLSDDFMRSLIVAPIGESTDVAKWIRSF
jgi:hypothetical protein